LISSLSSPTILSTTTTASGSIDNMTNYSPLPGVPPNRAATLAPSFRSLFVVLLTFFCI
jgi:hypothetical protein